MDKKDKLDYLIGKLSKLSYVSAIFLFGSSVNGRARADSDIDLAVLTKNASHEQEMKIIGYGDDVFNISTFSHLPLVIQFRVLRDGKILFSRDYRDIYDAKVQIFRRYWDFAPFINRFYKRILKNV